MACLRLLTVPPLPPLPLFNWPRLNLCISRSTSLEALGEYLLAMRMLQIIGVRVDDHGKSALGHGPSGEMHNQRKVEIDHWGEWSNGLAKVRPLASRYRRMV